MERDPLDGGSDVGLDLARDLGDGSPGAIRDAAPDVLAPIDAGAPVSGHVPAPAATQSAAEAPEHDWSVARGLVQPCFRPVGTHGLALDSFDRESLQGHGQSTHAQPIVDTGPAGLPVVYVIPAGGFDIVVNGEHVLSWGIEPVELQDAAIQNLTRWAAGAAWTEETSGVRRLISSQTGDGQDAARILLPDAIEHLTRQLSGIGRILIGLPERHLLTAATLRADDAEFADLFAEFVVEQSGGADEPIDRRVFELVEGRLVEFAG